MTVTVYFIYVLLFEVCDASLENLTVISTQTKLSNYYFCFTSIKVCQCRVLVFLELALKRGCVTHAVNIPLGDIIVLIFKYYLTVSV